MLSIIEPPMLSAMEPPLEEYQVPLAQLTSGIVTVGLFDQNFPLTKIKISVYLFIYLVVEL